MTCVVSGINQPDPQCLQTPAYWLRTPDSTVPAFIKRLAIKPRRLIRRKAELKKPLATSTIMCMALCRFACTRTVMLKCPCINGIETGARAARYSDHPSSGQRAIMIEHDDVFMLESICIWGTEI